MGVSPLTLFNVAGSALRAQQASLDLVANNLANAATPGFKAARADLVEMRSTGQTSDGPPVEGSVWLAGTTRDFSQGVLTWTGNPLDMAIDGSGFFRVSLADGRWAYTRDGSFRRDRDGRLVSASGLYLDTNVQFLPEDRTVYVNADGSVWAQLDGGQPVQRGSISLYQFPNPEGLEAVGDNLFVETPASGGAQAGTPGQGFGNLVAGAREGSNVELPREVANMLLAQRSYSLSLRVLQALDEMQRQANDLTR